MSDGVVNFTFHGVGRPERALDDGEADVWLSRERFYDALDVAVERPDVRITFDDGNRSDTRIALPALQERGLQATFFVVAGRLDRPAFLSCSDLRTLVRAGMTIGSHGMRHVPWRGLGDDELDAELVTARERLEDAAGEPVHDLSCPFGSYDRRVLRRVRTHGYRRLWTSDRGRADPAAWMQPRNTVRTLDEVAAWPDHPGSGPARRAKLAVKRWR